MPSDPSGLAPDAPTEAPAGGDPSPSKGSATAKKAGGAAKKPSGAAKKRTTATTGRAKATKQTTKGGARPRPAGNGQGSGAQARTADAPTAPTPVVPPGGTPDPSSTAGPRPNGAAPGAPASPAAAPAPARTARPAGPRRARRRGRRVRRVIRRIDLWSVMKLALILYTCLYLAFLGAIAAVWGLAYSTGTVEKLQSFLSDVGLDNFRFYGDQMFRAVAAIGAVLVLAGTLVTVLATGLVNLISEITGGIRVIVIEEDPLPLRTRRVAPAAAATARPGAPGPAPGPNGSATANGPHAPTGGAAPSDAPVIG